MCIFAYREWREEDRLSIQLAGLPVSRFCACFGVLPLSQPSADFDQHSHENQ